MVITGLLILTGNILFLIKTGNPEKFITLWSYFVSVFSSTKDAFVSINDYEQSKLIIFIVLGLLLLAAYRLRKGFIPMASLVWGILCIFAYSVNPTIFSTVGIYYNEHHDTIAFLSVLLLTSIVGLMLFKKSGRYILSKLFVFAMEVFTLVTVVYYIGTSQSSKIAQFFYRIYSELSFAIENLSVILDVSAIVLIALIVLSVLYSTVLGIINWKKRSEELKRRGFTSDEILPHIGITVPAYNEEDVIIATVESALSANYPFEKLDIIVVCDGSKDGTLKKLLTTFNMSMAYKSSDITPAYNWLRTKPVRNVWVSSRYPNLKVILKENGGKFDALNCGLNFHKLSVTHVMNLDADTILEQDSVRKLAIEVARNKSEVLAVAGTILPEYRSQTTNTFKDWLLKKKTEFLVEWQRIDYISSFHISRGSLSLTNSIFIISGAFGLFNRQSLLSLLGYKEGLGEDMDVTLQLQSARLNSKKNGLIVFVPEAAAYTAAPLTLKELSQQRKRWFKGLLECLIRFRHLMFSKLWLSYLQFILVEFIAPILLPVGLIYLSVRPSIITSPVFIASMLIMIVANIICSITGLLIEKQYRKINGLSFLYIFTQFMIVPFSLFWRSDAFIQFKDKSWGVIRKSFL